MKIEFRLDNNDYSKLFAYQKERAFKAVPSGGSLMIALAILSAAILMGIGFERAVYLDKHGFELKSVLLISGIGFVIFTALYILRFNTKVSNEYLVEGIPKEHLECTTIVDSSGITFCSNLYESKYNWNSVMGIEEKYGCIFIPLALGHAALIPLNSISDDQREKIHTLVSNALTKGST